MIHGLGDPGSKTGDHRVSVARVMSHNDGVIDRQPDAGVDVIDGTGGARRSMELRPRLAWTGTPTRKPVSRMAQVWASVPCVAQTWVSVRTRTLVPHMARRLGCRIKRMSWCRAECGQGHRGHAWCSNSLRGAYNRRRVGWNDRWYR
jgi:hypothetical protein